MRYLMICGATFLAAAMLWPDQVAAKGPSGSSGSGSSKGSGSSGKWSGNWKGGNWKGGKWNDNWRWDYGYQWYPYHRYYNYYGYGYDEPIYENPTFSGLPIKIVNPPNSGATLTYTLNGEVYTIPPGYSQTFVEDRSWVIDFSRGRGFGEAEYSLEPGVFTFSYSPGRGWELFRQSMKPSTVGPTNPTPFEFAPVNPPPRSATIAPPVR